MHCTRCGVGLPDVAEYCAACGTQVIRVPASPASAAPITVPENWREEAVRPPSEDAPSWPAAAPVVRYAGIWLRLAAYTLDALLLSALVALALLAIVPKAEVRFADYLSLPLAQRLDRTNPAVQTFTRTVVPLWFFIGWLYYSLWESSRWQATPGKRLLGLSVTDLEGRRISFFRAAGRAFVMIAFLLVPFGFLTYVVAGFSARKQALHDMIAGCLILRR
jgi:uncharacterized RDD family membrane protein YckC